MTRNAITGWQATGKEADDGGAEVLHTLIDGTTEALNPRLDLMNHSPTGFAWGYLGSGPAQLSLAILADATGDDHFALRWYQRFKEDVIAHFPGESLWTLTAGYVQKWMEARAR